MRMMWYRVPKDSPGVTSPSVDRVPRCWKPGPMVSSSPVPAGPIVRSDFVELDPDDVSVGVTAQTPDINENGGFDPDGPNTGGNPVKLGFVTQPSNTKSGFSITPAPQVAIQDQFNNTVTTASATITVAIQDNPSGGTLYGTTTRTTTAGVATFPGLAIDDSGTGYTLGASAVPGTVSPPTTLAPAESAVFGIIPPPGDPPDSQLANAGLPKCGDESDDNSAQCTAGEYTRTPDAQLYVVPGSPSNDVTLEFDFIYREATFQNELAAFKVDDAIGSVDGKHPGDDGYIAAALARAVVIFTSGSCAGDSSNSSPPATCSPANAPDVFKTYKGGDRLAFVLIRDGTLAELKNNTKVGFYSIGGLNDGVDHAVFFFSSSLGRTEVAFEDALSPDDFNDFVFTVRVPPPPDVREAQLSPLNADVGGISIRRKTEN